MAVGKAPQNSVLADLWSGGVGFSSRRHKVEVLVVEVAALTLGLRERRLEKRKGGQWHSEKEPRLSVPLIFSFGRSSDQRWGREGN